MQQPNLACFCWYRNLSNTRAQCIFSDPQHLQNGHSPSPLRSWRSNDKAKVNDGRKYLTLLTTTFCFGLSNRAGVRLQVRCCNTGWGVGHVCFPFDSEEDRARCEQLHTHRSQHCRRGWTSQGQVRKVWSAAKHLQKGRLSGRRRISVKTSRIVTISVELRRPPASWPLRSIDTIGNVMADRRSAGTRSISYVPVLVVAL